nr:hypothetical protein [Tanacetum cinerariifolium]
MHVHIIVKDTRTMDMTINQQVALDEALVPHASRLRIRKSNFRLRSDITSKESTLQLVYDVLRLTPFYKAFLVIHAGILGNCHSSSSLNTFQDGQQETNSEAYKEYYAIASGAAPPKTKASIKKTKSSFDITITYPTAAGTRLSTSLKGKQPAKSSKAKDLSVLSKVAITRAEQMDIIPGVLDVPTDESDEEISWKSSDEDDDDEDDDRSDDQEDDDDQDDNDDDYDTDNDGDDFVHPKLSIHEEEAKDEESFNSIVQTPENSDDEGNDDASLGLNIGGKEGQDVEDDDEELYRDVNINLEGRDSSSVSSQFVTSMLNLSPDACIDSLFETTPRVDVQASTTIAPFTLTAPTPPPPTIPTISQTLEANFSEFVQTNQFARVVSSIIKIVERYMDQRMNKAVKVVVQIQSDRLQDEAQAENEEFLNNLEENIQKIIKEQVKEQVKVQAFKILQKIEKTVNEQLEAEVLTRSSNSSKISYAVAADLSEIELKKILIKKIEGKEQESTSAPKEKATKTTGKSTQGSKSYQKTASESAPAEEPIQTTQDLEEPLHQEFETGDVDNQPIAEASQHPEWFQIQKKPLTLDRAWNKTLPVTHGSIQPWISDLTKQADSYCSFNELMDTPMDFSAFLMNRIKVYTLTFELLAGPTYELMKGSCKSLVELKFFLEEVYKATTDHLDWNNPERQQYLHNLLKPLPLIPNS